MQLDRFGGLACLLNLTKDCGHLITFKIWFSLFADLSETSYIPRRFGEVSFAIKSFICWE